MLTMAMPTAQATTAPTSSATRACSRSRAWRRSSSSKVTLTLTLTLALTLTLTLTLTRTLTRTLTLTLNPSQARIGRCSCVATLCFLLGSATAGRLLPRRPAATEPLLLGAGLLASLLCAAVLLSPSWLGVCALFSGYYFVSAFASLAATTALEKRGRQIGHTDGVMALSVFLWTCGFAGGGAMANVACGGVASAARQRVVLALVGAATAVVCMFSLPGGLGRVLPGGTGKMKV